MIETPKKYFDVSPRFLPAENASNQISTIAILFITNINSQPMSLQFHPEIDLQIKKLKSQKFALETCINTTDTDKAILTEYYMNQIQQLEELKGGSNTPPSFCHFLN